MSTSLWHPVHWEPRGDWSGRSLFTLEKKRRRDRRQHSIDEFGIVRFICMGIAHRVINSEALGHRPPWGQTQGLSQQDPPCDLRYLFSMAHIGAIQESVQFWPHWPSICGSVDRALRGSGIFRYGPGRPRRSWKVIFVLIKRSWKEEFDE